MPAGGPGAAPDFEFEGGPSSLVLRGWGLSNPYRRTPACARVNASTRKSTPQPLAPLAATCQPNYDIEGIRPLGPARTGVARLAR
jgi:hypothetical protein